eukprot:Gb_13138 [translate_table: standard]
MLPCQKVSPFLLPQTVPNSWQKNSTSASPATKLPADSEKVKPLYQEMIDRSIFEEAEDKQSSLTLAQLSAISINDLAAISNNRGQTGKACSLDRPCVVDEVHLRRLDDLLENGGVHRRVIATITVKAPPREVWNVLTAYERLSEFVPNLAISKIIFRENNKVRLLQEGCKGLLYMVLHARVVLDLWEHPEHEIHFEQVEGDFDSFHGKWIFEQLGSQHTLLKYVVETKMQKNCLLAEAIVEEVSHFQRIWGMDPTYMPSRKSFERAGRFDLARAFEKWGGLHEVSRLLRLKVRHPRPSNSIEEEKDMFKSFKDFHFHDKMSYKSRMPHNSNKWLIMIDELGTNWIE